MPDVQNAEHVRQQCGLCGAFLPKPPYSCGRCGTEFDYPYELAEYNGSPDYIGVNGFARHSHGGRVHAHDGGWPEHVHPKFPGDDR